MIGDAREYFQFEDVLSDELRTLDRLRETPIVDTDDVGEKEVAFHRKNASSLAHEADLTGVAFSGGGIRSATFNLGVLQALAKVREKHKARKKGLLSRFDYLSTVSGGGYIGSWLTVWLHRRSDGKPVTEDFLNTVQHQLTTRPCGFGPGRNSKKCKRSSGFPKSPTTSGYPPLEHASVRHLRRHSNYLTPRLGLSGDTLALLSLFLRNFVLLQLALITLLASAVLLPYLFVGVSKAVVNSDKLILGLPVGNFSLAVGLIGLLVVLFGSSWQISRVQKQAIDRETVRNMPLANAILVVILTIASWMVVVGGVAISGVAALYKYVAIGGFTYLLAWWTGHFIRRRFHVDYPESKTAPDTERLRAVLAPLFTGLVFGLMGWVCGKVLDDEWVTNRNNLLAVVTLGPPAIMLVVSFIVTIHIGTARDLFSEMHREWWARLGGYVLLAGGLWLSLFAVAFYAPPVIRWLGNGGFLILAAWAGTTGAGAWIANHAMPEADDKKPSKIKPLLMNLAPWLFLIGLAFLVAAGISRLMIRLAGDPEGWIGAESLDVAFWFSSLEILSISWFDSLIGLVTAVVLFVAITWGLDINIFSAHTMYKNRLVRAYLGASTNDRSKTADPFTAFNKKDDVWLASLDEQRPIPILNATINMTGGDDLAWQTRRAASFSFTPKYVGYEAKTSSGRDMGDYRRTNEYGAGRVVAPDSKKSGFKIGTAMAISGAAASPNMGYHTSTGIAALLTAFNMRLGYWAGNPSRAPKGRSEKHWTAWRKKGPTIAAAPILKELSGSADGESRWVNLSDGGHFDNLGLYELVRRRCRFIVVTDAGCDPKHRFHDLANAIRKCWTDLGVHIYLPHLDDVALENEKSRYSKEHGCIGLIEYPDRKRRDPERFGIVLYLKCSLTKEDVSHFVDIRQYAMEHEAFPHQTTADQFFDEDQFEAYRHLGYCVVDHFRSTVRALFADETSMVDEEEIKRLVEGLRIEQKKFADFAASAN